MRLWLKLIRKEAQLTQGAVAKNCGISTQFYSYIENAERQPSVKVAKKIGKMLGFDWTLFFETDD